MSKVVLFFTMLAAFNVCAQQDTIVLPSIDVVEKRSFSESDITIWQGDSNNIKGAIGDLQKVAAGESGMHFRKYSPGNLATVSYRGGSSSQTQVLWNGLSIQNPMVGLSDLSLINISLFDRISINPKSNSDINGSGGIAGAIHLESNVNSDEGLNLGATYKIGSYALRDLTSNIGFSKKRFSLGAGINILHIDNDYKFSLENAKPRTLMNAQVEQLSILGKLGYTISENQKLTLNWWHNESQRGVPPVTTQTESGANQDDFINRFMLQWNIRKGKFSTIFKAAYFDERNDYQDSILHINNSNNFKTLFADAHLNWIRNNGLWSAGLRAKNVVARSKYYSGSISENRLNSFLRYNWNDSNWNINGHLHASLIDGKAQPLIPSIAVNYSGIKSLTIKGKFQRTYRFPGLNDRYWLPGGNVDLKAEQGWGGELGFHLREKSNWQSSVTFFSRSVKDWIQWAPKEHEPFYSAQNLGKVWSRGIESRIGWIMQTSKINLGLKLGHDYVLATNEIEILNPRIDEGDQLWYTPKHRIFGKVELDYLHFNIQYMQEYTSKSVGINDVIEPFYIGGIRLSKQILKQVYSVSIFGAINNVWDTSYRLIERRPMPGRNFELGIELKIMK